MIREGTAMIPRPRRSHARGVALTFLVLVALAPTGCAKPHKSVPKLAGNGPITAAELRRIGDRDTYTAIQLLRPQFLQHRGPTSFRSIQPTEPDVYVDGLYYGPIGSLRSLSSREIEEIRLLSVGDATLRYGTGHMAGVIDIISIH
jgi:hypothetical protein